MNGPANTRKVVVVGDVTMDWNIVHRPSGQDSGATWTSEDRTCMCWQRGGAALLGDLIAAVAARVGESGCTAFSVASVDVPRDMPSPADPRFHHSFSMWSAFGSGVWRVRQFLGIDRRQDANASDWMKAPATGADADLVVIDDAGLGYRDLPDVWPSNLDKAEWIVLKTARPVAQGPLWDQLLSRHSSRLIVLMSVADLRRTEVQISRRLSWEQTAQDVVWELTHNPRVNGLSRCAHVVISFGKSGAILLSQNDDGLPQALLLLEMAAMEGDGDVPRDGGMIGYMVTLTSAVVRELMMNLKSPDIARGVQLGISGMRRLYKEGYGSSGNCQVTFPIDRITAEFESAKQALTVTRVQNPVWPVGEAANITGKASASGFWTILEDRYSDQLGRIAEEIVLNGVEEALTEVPRVSIGKLTSVDRQEIEALRSIQNLIGEYCRHNQKRPLSIAVFGPPGSGKSFGVEQVANAVRPDEIKSLTFNLSQFEHPRELYGALHQVRDVGLSGLTPLVFWDEFDTPLDGQKLGWLRYFLAPMQDGSFQEGQITHPIGQCVFVFAGGTASRFEDFGTNLKDEEEQKAAKVPDFVSRLKGYLNVLGPNPQTHGGRADPLFIIRRAMLLRSLLERGAPDLVPRENGRKRLNIDPGVLRALLNTRAYKHGIRSMESVIAMSALSGRTIFERSSLPPRNQLDIHVDGLNFLALVQKIALTDELTEQLAAAAHRVYCDGKDRDGWKFAPEKSAELKTHPLLVPYDELPETAKEANRVTVRTIPDKLAMAGYVMLPARSNEPPLEFPGVDLEKLAQFEHALWMEAKLAAGFTLGTPTAENPKQNEYLLPWDQVPETIKQIDRDLVRGIPQILERAGYAVVKASAE